MLVKHEEKALCDICKSYMIQCVYIIDNMVKWHLIQGDI